MSAETGFLVSLGQTLATMSLYNEGHPARERAFDASFEQLMALTGGHAPVQYSFLGGETVLNDRTLTELGSWEWSAKLTEVGIQRIEVDADVSREAFVGFVDDLYRRLTGRGGDAPEQRQALRSSIRYGLVKVEHPAEHSTGRTSKRLRRLGGRHHSLAEEIATIEWVHGELLRGRPMPLLEIEAVVRSLATAMRAGERLTLPLANPKALGDYLLTHAGNVAVLAMALAEHLGLAPDQVRVLGVAGLLHDVGNLAVPRELLLKPEALADQELDLVRRHPIVGAKLILERAPGLGMAAVVAYEHHLAPNGEGYPSFGYPRASHPASRIVRVCDVYDALCASRPHRPAWEHQRALAYLEAQAGRGLDAEMARGFVAMMGEAQLERVDVGSGAGQNPSSAALSLPSAIPPAAGVSAPPS